MVVFALQAVAPGKDGYRTAIWAVDTAGGEPRRLTLGARNDAHPRFSPDGRTLAFLSDRRLHVEEEPVAGDAKEREDAQQIHLLPLGGGEATRLTDLPRGVRKFEWSPDGRRLLVLTSSQGATR
jgi:dipeptidyl aminopeptidase/acylaminoacyl peptidase